MARVQNFKGDATELKMQSVANPIFDLTDISLNSFYSDGFECSPFLLMLYDEARMPFYERIPRDAFVDFIKEALRNFPFTGTFDSYLFVLMSIFGSQVEVDFDIPIPGKLSIDIGAIENTEFDFIAREFSDGIYIFFDMVDYDGNILTFRGIPGIESQYELDLLFSEVMPAGITPDISLSFFTHYFWISEESSVFYDMVTDSGDNIIFFETGG